jgi:AcrR family transcriptional regulator
MNSQPRALTEPRRAENRTGSRLDQVLDEACRQLNTRGVSLAALSEIAARLGITRAAMYSYVADREDLVFQCCRRTLILVSRHLDEANRSGPDAVAILKNFIERVLDPNGPPLAARSEVAPLSAEHRQVIQTLYTPLVSRLAQVIESGARTGTLRQCDYEIMAQTILGLINWAPLAHQWLGGPSAESSRRLNAAVSGIVFDGIAADRSAPLQFAPIDLSPMRFPAHHTFDRAAINAARLEALLLTASRLFNRQGFDATSLQEIMTSIGTTKRTLYRHLADKQALAAACNDRAFRLFFHVRDGMLAYQGTRLQAIGAALHALGTAYQHKDLMPLASPVCYASLKPEDQQLHTERSKEVGGSYMKAMRDGVVDGSIADGDVETRIMLFPGVFSSLVKNDIPADEAVSERNARAIAELFCMGLRAGK